LVIQDFFEEMLQVAATRLIMLEGDVQLQTGRRYAAARD